MFLCFFAAQDSQDIAEMMRRQKERQERNAQSAVYPRREVMSIEQEGFVHTQQSIKSYYETLIRELQEENEALKHKIEAFEVEIIRMLELIEGLKRKNEEIDTIRLAHEKKFGEQISGLQAQLSTATQATQALQTQLEGTSFESLTKAFEIVRTSFWRAKPGPSFSLMHQACFWFNLPSEPSHIHRTVMDSRDTGKLSRFFNEEADRSMNNDMLKDFSLLFLPLGTKLDTDARKRQFFENPVVCSLNGLRYSHSSNAPENRITKFIFLKIFYFSNFITREEYLERVIQHRLFDLFLLEKERTVGLRNGKSVTFNFGPISFVSENIVSSPSPSRSGAAVATPLRYSPDRELIDESVQTTMGQESTVFSAPHTMIQINRMKFDVTYAPGHGPMVLHKIPLSEEETQNATISSPPRMAQSFISLDSQALSPQLQERLQNDDAVSIEITDPNDHKILDSLIRMVTVVETVSPSRILFSSSTQDDD